MRPSDASRSQLEQQQSGGQEREPEPPHANAKSECAERDADRRELPGRRRWNGRDETTQRGGSGNGPHEDERARSDGRAPAFGSGPSPEQRMNQAKRTRS